MIAAGCMFCFDGLLKSTVVPSDIKFYNVSVPSVQVDHCNFAS